METYHGYVRTTLDALILFEACRLGVLPRAQRRLSEKERKSIASGSVFVWDEREAGMRRWTDGKSWSASRVSGSFLTYREMEGKRPDTPEGYNPDMYDGEEERRSDDEFRDQRDSQQPEGFRYKPDGLMKQSFSITTSTHLKLHLISYFSKSSINDLPIPSRDPNLKHIAIPKGLYPDHAAPMDQTLGPHLYPLFQQSRVEIPSSTFPGQVQPSPPIMGPVPLVHGPPNHLPNHPPNHPPNQYSMTAIQATVPSTQIPAGHASSLSLSSNSVKTNTSPLPAHPTSTAHYYAPGLFSQSSHQQLQHLQHSQHSQQVQQVQPQQHQQQQSTLSLSSDQVSQQASQMSPHNMRSSQLSASQPQSQQSPFNLPPLTSQAMTETSPLQPSVIPASATNRPPLNNMVVAPTNSIPLQYEPAVPRVSSLGAADIPPKKVMWGEDARAINVLDRKLNF